MTNTNVRLAYQTESGLQLDTINRIAEYPGTDSKKAKDYIKWLEELAELMLFIQDVNYNLTKFFGGDGENKK